MKLKKASAFIATISSIGIIISEIMALVNSSQLAHQMLAVSFLGLGIGAVLMGIHQLIRRQ